MNPNSPEAIFTAESRSESASMKDVAPPLEAKTAPWIKRLIAECRSLPAEWLDKYGSPLHVVVTSEFQRNAAALLTPQKERGLSGGLYFARKANKLPCFAKAAQKAGLGVDTASDRELSETLALGVDPRKIIVTAIGKEQKLVTRAIAAGCLLVLDNDDELALTKATAHSLGMQAHIGLRFSGFTTDRLIDSRFGFPLNDAVQLIEMVQDPQIKLELLHAHLDRYDVHERSSAARQLMQCLDQTRARRRKIESGIGEEIKAIDLGGGILMRYLAKEEHWRDFLAALDEADKGTRAPFTWGGDNFGLKRRNLQDGAYELTANLYPAWNNLSKERFIAAVLDDRAGRLENLCGAPEDRQLYKEINDRGLSLYFEPGRALLDNCGVTLARVCLRKRDTQGNLLIGLEMNNTNLRPFRAEFTVDPYLLAHGERRALNEGVYLVGNRCAEGDLILRRKLNIGRLPECGDIFCFPNTAGYLAHHMETPTHGGSLPANILIDENYSIIGGAL